MRRNTKIFAGLFLICVSVVAGPPQVVSWVPGGTIVCDAPYIQDNPAIAPDGAGGAIIVWEDNRNLNNEIYAQRISPRGAPLWNPDDVVICEDPSFQYLPEIAPDGAGGAFITWVDRRNGSRDIYAQRVDANGNMLWVVNGIAVCTADEDQQEQKMIADGEGGFIVVWQDKREDGTHNAIYAQRVGANGTMQWAVDGVVVCDDTLSQDRPSLVSDGTGGAVIVWRDMRNTEYDIFAQRMSAGGSPLWGSGGIPVVQLPTRQENHTLASDGAGGAIVAWTDQRDSPEIYIYAQRINASGIAQWPINGVALSTANSRQEFSSAAPDGAGGAIIAWEQNLNNRDIHAQRIGAGGALLWTSAGVSICSASSQQDYVEVQSDGAGGAVMVWEDARGGSDDFYAQRVDANGNTLWTPDGVVVCSADGYQDHITFTADGAGGTILTWEDNRIGPEPDIYAALLGGDGELVATLLQTWNAVWRDRAVVVEWTVWSTAGVGSFTVERGESAGQGPWREFPAEIEGDNGSYRFEDETCRPGSFYRYRVYVSEGDERRMLFETGALAVPSRQVELYQNHPNPFNPTTAIRFYVPAPAPVILRVYDSSGGLVTTLIAGELMTTGSHEVTWDGKNGSGADVASGIYLCKLNAGRERRSMKILLIR